MHLRLPADRNWLVLVAVLLLATGLATDGLVGDTVSRSMVDAMVTVMVAVWPTTMVAVVEAVAWATPLPLAFG